VVAPPSTSSDPLFEQGLVDNLPRLRASALRLSGDAAQADDLVQDTLVRALRHVSTFSRGSNQRAWLHKILRNTFLTAKSRPNRETGDLASLAESQLAAGPSQDHRLWLIETLRALERLPVQQRDALHLVGAAGCSYAEAAALVGCEVGTMKSRVARGRACLATTVGPLAGPRPVRRERSPQT